MYTFICSLLILIIGYFIYGKYVDRVFGSDSNRAMPSQTKADGVDFVPLSPFKSLFVQFLNVVGTGPIFGAIAGALFGPIAFVWIVFGCIFVGAVHDFFSGMLSVRTEGGTIGEIVGNNLGPYAKKFVYGFSVILLLLVGVVFLMSPAKILVNLLGGKVSYNVLLIVIFTYYILATILPVDKVIGKLYPIFGMALFFMAIGISVSLIYLNITGKYHTPEITEVFKQLNYHPKLSLFPYLFISIACGAVSGFHATQSPIIARCITNEKYGRKVFYLAMIGEGIVACIWAAAAMTLFPQNGQLGLSSQLAGLAGVKGGAPVVVNEVAKITLGTVGAVLAIIGVVVAPITSGDTAFRGARLTIADALKIEQKSIKNRYLIAIPLFILGGILTQVDFKIIWRYFAWSNQTLGLIGLWSATAWLLKRNKNYLITFIPALFMTMISTSYIIMAPEGFGVILSSLGTSVVYIIGISVAVIVTIFAAIYTLKTKKRYAQNNLFIVE